MISVDTNILLFALNSDAREHQRARAFLESEADNPDFVVSELVLVELYVLLRNPTLVRRALKAEEAVEIVSAFRTHPTWQLVDHRPEVMDDVWRRAEEPALARHRIYDARLALSLRRHGVKRFATCNEKDFKGFGFDAVWNPLAAPRT